MKRIAFFLIILSAGITANGQILNRLLSSEQEFLRLTTDSALVVVRQEYLLQSTDTLQRQEFGRGGREWFGRGVAIGVVAREALILPIAVTKPWSSDPFYTPYQHTDTLKPLATTLAVRPFNCNTFSTITRRADTLRLPDSASTVRVKYDGSAVLPLDCQTTDTAGWLVLAYADSDSGQVTLKRFQVRWLDAAARTIKPPDDPARLLGGVYVTLKFTTGLMQVKIGGFVVRKPFNWVVEKIEPPFSPVRQENKPAKTPEPLNLTPVEPKER